MAVQTFSCKPRWVISDANPLPEETVVHRATLHWLIFGKAMAVTALGIALLAVEPTVGMLVAVVGAVMFVPPLIA